MNKKVLIGAVGAVALGVGTLVPLGVYAAVQTTDPATTFVQKLAAKLGIDESKVQSAVTATRDEIKTDRETQMKADIAQAVTDGKLTQRQADILNAEIDVRASLKPDTTQSRPDFTGMNKDQIKIQMDTMRAQMDQKLVDALNAKGLNTTLDEVKAAREAARTAGIEAGRGRGHGFGPGMM